MKQFYVPYIGKKLAPLVINGHRVLILAHDKEDFALDLGRIGADRIMMVKSGDSQIEQEMFLGKLAAKVGGGVVVAPPYADIADVVKNLESELPWIQ